MRVLGLSEEARGGFGRDEIDPQIEDVHRVPTLVSAHRRCTTAADEEHAMEIALPAKLENFVHAQVRVAGISTPKRWCATRCGACKRPTPPTRTSSAKR